MASKRSRKTTGRRTVRKTAVRKTAVRKTAARKTAARKTAARKTAARKTAASKPTRKWVIVENVKIDSVNSELASSIREQKKLVAEKQKELESHQAKISSQKDLYQSRQDGLENMRIKLLNLQTQYKVLHMQTDSHRKLLDETIQRYSMDDLEVEHHELESEIESKRDEIADLKKQKQSVIQQTEQITQKISEQQKQLVDHTDTLSSHLEMVEKQKTVILEEISQAQAKKQVQEDELQALTKERLGLVSKNKDKQGMDEQIQKYRGRLHAIQNERSMLELEIKSQMNLLNQERQKEKEIMASILQKYN